MRENVPDHLLDSYYYFASECLRLEEKVFAMIENEQRAQTPFRYLKAAAEAHEHLMEAAEILATHAHVAWHEIPHNERNGRHE